jgi:hypothetical protein
MEDESGDVNGVVVDDDDGANDVDDGAVHTISATTFSSAPSCSFSTSVLEQKNNAWAWNDGRWMTCYALHLHLDTVPPSSLAI